jgi:hypothetical protein
LRPGQPGGQQRGPDASEASLVAGIAVQLQHRRAGFEGTGLGYPENRGGPVSVVVAEYLGQLRRRPDVGRTLAAVGIGVQRRGEHVAVA